jgi:hypothetical protein
MGKVRLVEHPLSLPIDGLRRLRGYTRMPDDVLAPGPKRGARSE